jgi:hypothetical protein
MLQSLEWPGCESSRDANLHVKRDRVTLERQMRLTGL